MNAKESTVQYTFDLNLFLRVLPKHQRQSKESFLSISSQGDSITIKNPDNKAGETKNTFRFERVFTPEASQNEVYQEIESGIIEYLFKGNSVGIFSFGQEGSGKTYTLFGEKCLSSEIEGGNIDDKGIMNRACKSIIEKMAQLKVGTQKVREKKIELKAQFYQVKQLAIQDLLKVDSLDSFKSISYFH